MYIINGEPKEHTSKDTVVITTELEFMVKSKTCTAAFLLVHFCPTPGDFNAVINVLQENGSHDPFAHSLKTAMNRSRQLLSFFLIASHSFILSPSWMATWFHSAGISATT
jgi:hypothetical protein